MGSERLRPLERAVARLAAEGRTSSDIAWRFRRSPGHIERVMEMSELRHRAEPARRSSPDLRPVERLVIRARDDGRDLAEVAARMRRSPEFVTRVAKMVDLKRGIRPGGA